MSALSDDARTALAAARSLTDIAVDRCAELTGGGRRIDDHQVVVDRVAYAATEARAAAELAAAADAAPGDADLAAAAAVAIAELAASARDRLAPVLD